jgi:hypothetical protein
LYPGLSSLLQQLAADPSDELLASRIVALLQDIPDGEYKVDQLLAAAQMMLAVSPRLGLICAHAAFRSAPSRLESLAIAEEALAKMGRRAKVQVLRQERKRLEAEVTPNIELTATVSKFLLNEESAPIIAGPMRDASEGSSYPDSVGVPDATVLISKSVATVPPAASIISEDVKANYELWQRLAAYDNAALNIAIDRATTIARMKGDSLFDAVEKIAGTPGLGLAAARMTAFLVVDAVLAPEASPEKEKEKEKSMQRYEIATGIMARLLAWHEGDLSEVATAVRDSVALRLNRLPGALQEGLNRVLREQTKPGRPSPTFSTTTL